MGRANAIGSDLTRGPILSRLVRFSLGALGFFLGSTLAGFITVIWGDLYFLSGQWDNRTVLLTGEGSGGIN